VIPVAVSTVPPLGDWLIGPLRPCEWALLVWLVLAPAIGRRLGLARFSLPLLLLLLVHLLAEGWRWQMAPLYAAAPAMLLWVAVPAWPRFVAWLAGVIGPAAGVAALVLAVLVPIFYLPPARGSAAVGTRLDRLPGPDGTGDIYLQTWYPADLDHAKIAAYRGQSDRLLLSYQRLVPTGAGAEAPPVADIPPLHVVLLVHGLGGSRAQNTSLALDLASQGYLVAAYDRPDGTDPGVAIDLSSDAGRLKTLATGAAGTAAGAADASYVLDALGHLGAPFFAGRVATDRAVIIGYSFGGSIAAEACRRDHRFVAVMNMDGWLFNSARGQGVPCPYVLMNDGEPVPPASDLDAADPSTRAAARMQIEDSAAQERSFAHYGGWDLTITGASHTEFSDGAFYAPLDRTGNAPRGHVQALMRIYAEALCTLAFTGQTEPALDAAPPGFPELQFRRRPPGNKS
jgi:dienelactone hydrolase